MSQPEQITPWSETRADNPVELPNELSEKNSRLFDPMATADLYYELYDNAAQTVKVTHPETDNTETYKLVANVSNPESSSHLKVIMNPETHHYIMLAKGMDLFGRDEGAGKLVGPLIDLAERGSAENNSCLTNPVLDAETAYLELLQNPNVKSLEVVGYSIGTISTNYLAAVYGAKTTNIADLGVPGSDSALSPHLRSVLPNHFNTCANGLYPPATGAFVQNLNDNVIGLKMRADFLGGTVGGVGKEYGEQIVLDKDNFEIKGAGHVPEVYADTAKTMDPTTPDVEAAVVSKETQFEPFGQLR